MIVTAGCDHLCEFGKINEKSMMLRLRNSAPRTIDPRSGRSRGINEFELEHENLTTPAAELSVRYL